MLKKVIVAIAAAGILSACAQGKWDVEGAQGMENMGSPFQAALQKEYSDLAFAERSEGDWDDTAYFVAKATGRRHGRAGLPDRDGRTRHSGQVRRRTGWRP